MSDDFLSRWSRRKVQARTGNAPQAEPAPEKPVQAVIPAQPGTPKEAEVPVALPPVDSLTIDSDFTPFLQPGVDPGLKREALKKLVRDPRFNVMDGLDVYIDDYSKPDPLPEGWLEKLNQMKHLGHYLEPKEGETTPGQEPAEAAPAEPDPVAPAPASPAEGSQDSE